MAKKTIPITSKAVKTIIAERVDFLQKKKELWAEAEEIEKKLEKLHEMHGGGFAGSFGFAHAADRSNATKTGFQNDIPLGRLSELGAEIQAENEAVIAREKKNETINEEVLDEIKKMKAEIESLKKEGKKKPAGDKKKIAGAKKKYEEAKKMYEETKE